MNLKQLFIVASYLWLFAVIALAQKEELPPPSVALPQGDVVHDMTSVPDPPPDEPLLDDVFQHPTFTISFTKSLLRESWMSRGLHFETLSLLENTDVRAAWGISDEQWLQISEHVGNAFFPESDDESTESEKQTVEEEETKITIKVDVETGEGVEEFGAMFGAALMEYTVEGMDKILTPEQWQKINESQLANIDEMPLVSPSMFEALNLTDAQKQQMEQIKKELEPEFEKTLENWLNSGKPLQERVTEELKKEENKGMDYVAMWKKLKAEDPEFKKIDEKSESLGKAFSTKFKIKMFDVLTDEQWVRLQKLIDDPPEHAKILRKKLKELSGEDEETAKKDSEKKPEMYIPGPNSWKPGDAIPEQYRQERNERQGHFPRTEEQSRNL